MAITAYTGPPGAGKTYALIHDVILPALADGRTVRTNVDGIKPQAIYDYLEAKHDADDIGELLTFDRADLHRADFFPTESIPDTQTTVKGGDLLVIDEWKLSFPNRGASPNANLEPYLRWHRHLVDKDGQSSDVVIGTQLITDIHRDYRGCVERSYKFKKLGSVGLAKGYQFQVFEGCEQRKGTAIRTGNGKYRKEVFPLYQSFATDGDAKEKGTDKRASLFSRGFIILGVLAVAGVVGGTYNLYQWFGGSEKDLANLNESAAAVPSGVVQPQVSSPTSTIKLSPFRIVGVVEGDSTTLVVIADDNGTTRLERARDFEFRDGRPVSGMVDGMRVVAADRVNVQSSVEFE